MKKLRLFAVLLVTLGVLALSVQPALAFPPLPSSFYGTVKIDGANVPSGTVVSARINGVEYDAAVVTTYQGNTVYSLDVPGDDTDSPGTVEGGVAGDTITFYIDSLPAAQTATWQSGTNVSLNLTTATNQAPTDLSLSANTVAENAAVNTVVGTLSSSDPDAGDSFTYSLVSGTGSTDNTSFNISGSSLRTSAAFNFEVKSSYSVRIRTTDHGGLYYEKAFTITVTNVNEAPTDLSLSASTVAENAAADTVVGTLSSSDPDAGDSFTYSLVSGTGSTDNASFNISGNSLRTSAAFNFEVKSSYSVRIRTTDQGGLYYEEAFTITVTNVNEAPTDLSLSASTVAENAVVNTVVGTLSSSDPDAGDSFTYSLVSGTGSTDNASFNISGSSLRTSAVFNFEVKSSYLVRMRTTDQGGLYYEKSFTITVTDVNEAPVITESDPQTVSMSQNGTPVPFALTLHATDVDTQDTLTWSISSPASHGTAGASGTGTSKSISYTPNAGYAGTDSFVVQVSDGHGGTDTITVNVTISAVASVSLSSGWNLVSFHIHPGDTAPASVLASIEDDYALVYAWDAATGTWLKYDPNVGYGNSLTALDEKMGFWIQMETAETLVVSGSAPASTDIALKAGWNLVGFPSTTALALPGAFSEHGVGADLNLVYAYHANDPDDLWKKFDPSTGIGNDLTGLVSGWGYWVQVDADRTWSVSQ